MEVEGEWMVQISNELKSSETSQTEMKKWKKHCIYKIPPCVAESNKRSYMPQTVSFGPDNYGKEHLQGMEEHKHRVLLHFLKRCGKPLELLFQSMAQVEKDLRDAYKPLDWKEGDHNGFLRLMIVDRCFMLEVLRTAYCVPSDYAEDDPVFSDHGRLYLMPYIKRDMLMLENQLPLMVLQKLIEFEGHKDQGINLTLDDEEFLNRHILKFFSPSSSLDRSFGPCLHMLDVCRKSLLQHGPTHLTSMPKATNPRAYGGDDDIMWSAYELRDAGIIFKRSKTQSLRDLSFNGGNGILRLPSIIIDDSTGSLLLNLVAFKRLHVGAGNDVSSYVFFMASIIDNETDVAILHQRGIISNALGSDKAVARLFNLLSRDLTVDREGTLNMVQVSECRYCKRPWNRWRANLIETYFRNPWSIVSLIAAIFLFVLTTIQTVYTIKPLYNPSSTPSPPSPLPPPPRH